MTRVEIKPATKEVIDRYYDGKLTRTVRAFIAVQDEKILGIAGVYVDQSRLVMFSDLSDELKQNKRVIIRGMRMFKEIARKKNLPIHAKAAQLPTAKGFLKHMGFIDIGQGLYEWHKHKR